VTMVNLGTYELADHLFPDCIRKHRLEYPDTDLLEVIAAQLAATAFPQGASLRFLRQVCRWGGYYGIAARVQQNNQPGAICQALTGAWQMISQSDPMGALEQINALHGLSRPSFASKFIRFLSPHQAPIFDRIISEQTGFSLTAAGYGLLIKACQHAAEHLAAAGIGNPVRPDGAWYIADIEAAFYADMGNLEA
jgi:hypothetical protein